MCNKHADNIVLDKQVTDNQSIILKSNNFCGDMKNLSEAIW